LSERLRGLRAQGGRAMVAYLIRHLRGHIQYYGVSGNSRGVSGYLYAPRACCSNGSTGAASVAR
jgi:RNA-directed DNA polymerase